MSEQDQGGAVLEDAQGQPGPGIGDAAPAAPAADAAAEPGTEDAAAAEAAAADDAAEDDEGTDEQQPPKQRGRLMNDLISTRKRAQTAEQKLQALEHESQLTRPILEAIARHPQGLAVLQSILQDQAGGPVAAPAGGVPAPAAAGPRYTPQQEQHLARFAERFGLYNRDGSPNLQAAAETMDDIRGVSQEVVKQAVAPVQHATVRQQASAIYQSLAEQATREGVDAATLSELAQAVGPELFIQPGVADLVYSAAAGKQVILEKRGARRPAAAAPIYTESSGGRTAPVAAALPAPLQRVLRQANLSDKDIAQSTSAYKPGQPNALE
jgi:hypothetical protein